MNTDITNRIIDNELVSKDPRIFLAPCLVMPLFVNSVFQESAQLKHCCFHFSKSYRITQRLRKLGAKLFSGQMLGYRFLIEDSK